MVARTAATRTLWARYNEPMRVRWFGVIVSGVVVAAPACTKKPTPTSAPQATQGPETPVAPTPPPATHPPPCILDGRYRLRYSTNGHTGWWMRFDIEGGKATMLEKTFVLFDKGPVATELDTKACVITLTGKSYSAGDIRVEVVLDPRNGRVEGTLRRTKAHNEKEKNTEIAGVRDDASPSGPACIVPGMYQAVFSPDVPWVNKAEGDDRECKDADKFGSPFVFRVEPFGESLAVTIRESDPPYDEAWASDKLVKLSKCAATFELQADQLDLTASLEFHGATIRGTATRAALQRVEEWEEGEEVWDCVGKDVPLVITKLR